MTRFTQISRKLMMKQIVCSLSTLCVLSSGASLAESMTLMPGVTQAEIDKYEPHQFRSGDACSIEGLVVNTRLGMGAYSDEGVPLVCHAGQFKYAMAFGVSADGCLYTGVAGSDKRIFVHDPDGKPICPSAVGVIKKD